MAQCDPTTLLDQAKCYYTLDSHRLNVIIATLWCQISEGIAPPPGVEGGWWNVDVDSPIVNPDEGGDPIVNPDVP